MRCVAKPDEESATPIFGIPVGHPSLLYLDRRPVCLNRLSHARRQAHPELTVEAEAAFRLVRSPLQ
jgi:hypothetical protein